MPLTTTCSGPLALATTCPPGHIQNVYTPRSPLFAVSRYSAAPSRGWFAIGPYWLSLISDCGCSARTPIANAFGAIETPFSYSIRAVSRAPCPIARISAAHGSQTDSSPCRTSAAVTAPSVVLRSASFAEKRTSPPAASILFRRFPTTVRSRSVPICGFARYAISSGAPLLMRSPRTPSMCGSRMRVVSFPSENVPAPPSPNATLLSGSGERSRPDQ